MIPKKKLPTNPTDQRGVSPVIAVILLVAVTVILAAVIATFALGMGESVENTAPTISFACEDGDPVVRGGQTDFEGTLHAGSISGSGADSDSISAGVTFATGSQDIIWESPAGDTTAIIFEGCE